MVSLKLVYIRVPSYTGYKNAGILPQRMSLLEPKAAAALSLVIRDSQGLITFTDVFRTALMQIDAIRDAARNKKRLYAPPTKSGHQFGMSVDIAVDESLARLRTSQDRALRQAGASRDSLAAWLKPYGWHGIKGEPWHFDYLDGHKLVVDRIQALYGSDFVLGNIEVQRALNRAARLGVIALPELLVEDGLFGPNTRRAIARARERFEMPAGDADPWFRRVLACVTADVEVIAP